MKMKRAFALTMGMVLTGLVGMMISGRPAEAKASKSAKHLIMAEGKVTSVDGNSVTLELDNAAILTLHAGQDTNVMIGAKEHLDLSVVQAGQMAKVRYTKEGKALSWIRVRDTNSKKAK